jgi:hypothetical protein
MVQALKTIRLLHKRDDKFMSENPHFLSIYFTLYTDCVALEDFATPFQHLHDALDFQPLYIDAVFGLGMLYSCQYDVKKSEDYFRRYLKLQEVFKKHGNVVNTELWTLDFPSEANFYLGVCKRAVGKMAEGHFEFCRKHGSDQIKKVMAEQAVKEDIAPATASLRYSFEESKTPSP